MTELEFLLNYLNLSIITNENGSPNQPRVTLSKGDSSDFLEDDLVTASVNEAVKSCREEMNLQDTNEKTEPVNSKAESLNQKPANKISIRLVKVHSTPTNNFSTLGLTQGTPTVNAHSSDSASTNAIPTASDIDNEESLSETNSQQAEVSANAEETSITINAEKITPVYNNAESRAEAQTTDYGEDEEHPNQSIMQSMNTREPPSQSDVSDVAVPTIQLAKSEEVHVTEVFEDEIDFNISEKDIINFGSECLRYNVQIDFYEEYIDNRLAVGTKLSPEEYWRLFGLGVDNDDDDIIIEDED